MRNRKWRGADEAIYLDVLDATLTDGTQADQLVAKFKGPWAGSVDPAFRECVYDSECVAGV